MTTSLGRLVRPGAREQHPGRADATPSAPATPSARTTPSAPATPSARPASATRRVAADGAAAAVMITAAPLCLLQAPNAIAWALSSAGALAAGPQASTTLLRAAGLALPAMAAVAGLAALAVLRVRAWPVLLTGLLMMAVADTLGTSAHTTTAIAVVRMLHGIAAGLALPAALALAWDRGPGPRRWLAALWSAATVAALAAAPAVARDRLTSGGWHAALAPYPWLTGAALTVAALYAVLADGPGRRARDTLHPGRDARRQDATQERAQLAVLAVPGIGLAALAVAITYRPPAALLATGAVAVLMLYGVAAVASADRLVGGGLCFPFLGAVTGLVVAPVAGAVTSLRALSPDSAGHSWLPLSVTAVAALAGVAVARALPHRPRAVVMAGLLIAVEGLAAARLAGPYVPAVVLAGVSAPLAAGLAAALTAALAETGVAGALSGVSLLLAGLMTGYLASGAVQVRMVTQAVTQLAASPAARQAAPAAQQTAQQTAQRLALAGAVGVWELAGLFSVLIAIGVTFLIGRARRTRAPVQ
ncbi:MAG: hypothetical protein JO016_10455 [Actinobacteria bacterium]|nr:hypothetical protein [Actinomycetota bacterium]